jgi:hypothetical protein
MALPWSSEQHNITTPVTSDVGASLAEFNGRLYATWKASSGENKMCYSSFDGRSWSLQMPMGRFGTSSGASLVFHRGALYAAYKGPNRNEMLYWTRFDGKSWETDKRMGDYTSTAGPTLVTFRDGLSMLCKGSKHDNILHGFFDGSTWKKAFETPFTTSTRPGAAVLGEGDRQILVMVWKGVDVDGRLWYSTFDGVQWAPAQPVPGSTQTVDPPALTTFRGIVYVAWRGNDQSVQYTSFDGYNWSPEYRLRGPKAGNCGPSLGVFRNQLVATWVGEDSSIWWTQTGVGESRDVNTMVQDMTLKETTIPESTPSPLDRTISGPPLSHVASAPAVVTPYGDHHHPPEGARYPPEGARYPPEGVRYPPEGARYPPQQYYGAPPNNPPYHGPPSMTHSGHQPVHPSYAAPHTQPRQAPHPSHQVTHARPPPPGASAHAHKKKESFISELEHDAKQEAKRDVKAEVKKGIRVGMSTLSGNLFSSFGGNLGNL